MRWSDVRLLSDQQRAPNPVLLFAFTGWNDAGDGASGAIRVLAEHWDATAVAEIDPEPFTDFATVRPFVVIDEGHRQIVWPTVDVWAASLPSTDVLLVVGPEPALQWRRFCDQLRQPRRALRRVDGHRPRRPARRVPAPPAGAPDGDVHRRVAARPLRTSPAELRRPDGHRRRARRRARDRRSRRPRCGRPCRPTRRS